MRRRSGGYPGFSCRLLQASQHRVPSSILDFLDNAGGVVKKALDLLSDSRPVRAHHCAIAHVTSHTLQEDITIEQFHLSSIGLAPSIIKIFQRFLEIFRASVNPVKISTFKEPSDSIVGVASGLECIDRLIQDILCGGQEGAVPGSILDQG